MPSHFRRLMIPQALLLGILLLVLAADMEPFAALLNPHSELGGSTLLVLLALCLLAICWLAVGLPRAVLGLIRGNAARSWATVGVAGLGLLQLLVFGGWLVFVIALRP